MQAFEELNDNYDPNNKLKSLDKLFDPDKNKVQIKGIDLSDIHDEVFSKLQVMPKLQLLKLENCRIDVFEPTFLSERLKHISLQRNNISNLDQIIFDANKNKKYDLSEIQLLTLDLSANKFTEFPFEALHL